MLPKIFVLASPHVASLWQKMLAGACDVETVRHTDGEPNVQHAFHTVGSDVDIRHVVVVTHKKVCPETCRVIGLATRQGKPTTIITIPDHEPGLAEQAAAIGARFFSSPLDREAVRTLALSGIAARN